MVAQRRAPPATPALQQHVEQLPIRVDVHLDVELSADSPGRHRGVRPVAQSPCRRPERGGHHDELGGQPPGGVAGDVRALCGHHRDQAEQTPAHLGTARAQPVIADHRHPGDRCPSSPNVAGGRNRRLGGAEFAPAAKTDLAAPAPAGPPTPAASNGSAGGPSTLNRLSPAEWRTAW